MNKVMRMKQWIVWGVVANEEVDEMPVDHCNSLGEAMRSPLPGIVHEFDVVTTADGDHYTFLNDRPIGVNDALRARLH